MQTVLTAGDTLDFTTTVADYPPADGWTFKIRLVPRSVSNSAVTLTGTTSGTDYRVQSGPAVTALWGAGEYAWSSWVEKAGARYSIDAGQLTVRADPSALTAGSDTRSEAERAVADLKTAYATFAGSQGHVAEYEIAGRRMRFATAADILARLSFWQSELTKENAAKAVAMGLPDPRRIYLRAGRA